MEDRVIAFLKDFDENIVNYEGKSLVYDGLLSSLAVLDLATRLEEEFGVEIAAKDITEENFRNKEAIVSLVKMLLEDQ